MLASPARAAANSKLNSGLSARAVASALKRASSSSKSFISGHRWHVQETGVDNSMPFKPSVLSNFLKRASLLNHGEVRFHPAHDPSHIRQCSPTEDLHDMDPLDRIRQELDEEMKSKKMCNAVSAASCKLVFLGGPGVGKGTWASLLSKRLSIPHISTGDLVRKELSKATSSCTTTRDLMLRKTVKTAMNQGKLLADDIIVKLLSNRLKQMDPSVGFILDGFPRTVSQASMLDNAVGCVDMAVSFHLIEEALVAKCLGRRVCSDCGKDYNVAHVDIHTCECTDKGVIIHNRIFLPSRLPPPECASKLKVGGDDSNESAVRERLRLYAHESEPLQQHYRNQGKLVELDVGPGADYVWPRLVDAVGELEHDSSHLVASC